MKIVFFGSDDFAAAHLKRLHEDGHDIVAVVTTPDRPKGRGMKISLTPTKEWAGEKGIPVLQPDHLEREETIESLRSFDSDLFVVIAYGYFLPQVVLDLPRLFSINVHASLLPRYRGAAPINWALLNGEGQTGISIIKMNRFMDAGEIVAQEAISISPEDTAVFLREKLIEIGVTCLSGTVQKIQNGDYDVREQGEGVTFAPKLKKEFGHIDWNRTAVEIHNKVRGLCPWPSAYTFVQGKRLKILGAQPVDLKKDDAVAGEVVEVSAKGICVATGQGGLLLQSVHPESSKAMSAGSFAAGHSVTEGCVLGT